MRATTADPYADLLEDLGALGTFEVDDPGEAEIRTTPDGELLAVGDSTRFLSEAVAGMRLLRLRSSSHRTAGDSWPPPLRAVTFAVPLEDLEREAGDPARLSVPSRRPEPPPDELPTAPAAFRTVAPTHGPTLAAL